MRKKIIFSYLLSNLQAEYWKALKESDWLSELTTSEPLALAGDVHSEGTPSSAGRWSSPGRDPGPWPASRSSGRSLGTSKLMGLLPRRPCTSEENKFEDLWLSIMALWLWRTDHCPFGSQSLLNELIHEVREVWVAASNVTGDRTGLLNHLFFVGYTHTHMNKQTHFQTYLRDKRQEYLHKYRIVRD